MVRESVDSLSSKHQSLMSFTISHTDLTSRPPRSMRLRMGGYVLLPRILDKGRATLVGKNGAYNYNSLTDQRFAKFIGLDLKALLDELAKGKGDWEVFQWILANAKTPREPWEIEAWSSYLEKRGPESDAETLQFFAEYVGKHTTTREDLKAWFDVTDVDDFVSFGGQA